MQKRNLKIWVGLGSTVSAASLTFGLVYGLKNHNKPNKTNEVLIMQESVDNTYQKLLNKEQERINDIIVEDIEIINNKAQSSGVYCSTGFNEKIANILGIDFTKFNKDKFNYTYYLTKDSFEIVVKLNEEEHKHLFSSVLSEIEFPGTRHHHLSKQNSNIASDQTSLDQEQVKINKLTSTLSNKLLIRHQSDIANSVINVFN